VGGVSCEPLSEANSLLTGKNTGNFIKSGMRFGSLVRDHAQCTWFILICLIFPDVTEQGINTRISGNHISDIGIRIPIWDLMIAHSLERELRPANAQSTAIERSGVLASLISTEIQFTRLLDTPRCQSSVLIMRCSKIVFVLAFSQLLMFTTLYIKSKETGGTCTFSWQSGPSLQPSRLLRSSCK
jgi:hypothetical protein